MEEKRKFKKGFFLARDRALNVLTHFDERNVMKGSESNTNKKF